jgi:plasmid stability protein
MATLTIRQLDDTTKSRLRLRAARHNRSMEAEAREILRCGLATSDDTTGLATAIRSYVEPFGGVNLELPKRKPMRKPPSVD